MQTQTTNRIADLIGNSVDLITEYRCKYHSRQNAVALCESCGADICGACANIRSHRTVCSKCMTVLDKALAGAGPASLPARVFTHPFVITLILVAVLGYLFYTFGQGQRKGLLGGRSLMGESPEGQFRLKLLLYAKKADRMETRADSLYEAGRLLEATAEYDGARAVYEMLAPETTGRWESNIVTLARARILKKMGEISYSEGLYKSLAALSYDDRIVASMAQFHLAQLQEQTDQKKAVESYTSFLRGLIYLPDSLSQTLNIMAHSEGAFSYERQFRGATRTDLDFDKAKIEALLQRGRLLIALGRPDDARDSLMDAIEEGAGTKTAGQARIELNKIDAVERRNEPPPERFEHKEKIEITHFD